MFSGIVETIGSITQLALVNGCLELTISPHLPFDDIAIGDSIAVNGICLTVTAFNSESFNVTAVPETLRVTNLNQLTLHSEVNLERAIKANSRISGHYVQGHVDAVGEVIEISNDNSNALLVKISVPEQLANYLVNKGYVGLDGMSITIIEATPTWFTVTFIPHTQTATIVHQYQVGSKINIEVDMMAKYIEKLIGAQTCKQPSNE